MSRISRLHKEAISTYTDENTTVWLPIASLVVDPAFQRGLDEGRAKRIADELDPDAIGVLHVSIREDGSRVILDGQHRHFALRLRGWGDQRVECKTYAGLSAAEEARLFIRLNESVKVQSVPKFRARVLGGEPMATYINTILDDNGWRVTTGGVTPGSFSAITAAEKVYVGDRGKPGSNGPKALAVTIRAITEAWGHNTAGVNAYIVSGLGLVITRHPDLDIASLVHKLSSFPGGPSALLGNARGLRDFRGGKLSHSVAEVIVELYNKRRNARRLPDWRA